MISKFNQIESLFKEVDKSLEEEVTLYVIGGATLLFRGLKAFTKDIDVIVKTSQKRLHLEKALRKIGFNGDKLTSEYKNLEITYILTRGEFRIDLFMRKVCSLLSLSENMEERAEIIFSGVKLKVYVCSNEDILLFKAIARRDADISDCVALAKENLDWDILSKEIQNQIKKGKDIWITYLAEGFEKIADAGVDIPIIKEIMKAYEDYFNSIDGEKK